MKTSVIYKLTSPSGNVYIGKTVSLALRLKQHESNAKQGHTQKLYKAIRKYGLNKFLVAVIVSDIPHYFVDSFEKYWINYYDSYKHGYNSTLGGEGVIGLRHSEISRRQMSSSKKGNTNRKGTSTTLQGIENIRKGQLGKTRTPESIKKTADALRNRKRPMELCEKLRKANLGKTHTTTTKEKLSVLNRDPTKYMFYNRITEIVEYVTSYTLGLKYGISTSSLRLLVQKRRKSCYNWVLLNNTNK